MTGVSFVQKLVGLLLLAALAAGCTQGQTMPAVTSTPIATRAPAAASGPTPFTRLDLSAELYIRQVRPDVFVVTHAFPWPANSLIVEMANSDLVLVGTPYTPEAMAEVLAWMALRFGERNILAINTGYHVDNLGGNRTLIEQGIPVYGSDLTAQLLAERGEQTRQLLLDMLGGTTNERYYQAQAEIPYLPPTQLFPIEQGVTLQFGDEAVQVYYPGPSHAPDKVVVYFPTQKVLFGGCLILGGDQVGNIADADLEHWAAAVRLLEQFDAEIVVPGHGERLDAGLIEHTITVLTDY